MKKISSLACAALLGVTLGQTSFAREGVCKITEPKGGPLNARVVPDGRIINKLQNGRKVYLGEISYDSAGQPWIKVYEANSGRYLGWVFREYISCY